MRARLSLVHVAERAPNTAPIPIAEIIARVTGGTVVTDESAAGAPNVASTITGRTAPRRRRPRLVTLRLVREGPFTGPLGHAAADSEPPQLRSPREVYAYMAPYAEREPVEAFWLLPLDAQHRLNTPGPVVITRGILNSSLVHPREVFLAAISARAASVILCHNHPSGDPTPSADDRAVTDQLVATGRVLDIPVLDHVVIGRGRYASFAAMGII
jgi:DNA repair protein RadC